MKKTMLFYFDSANKLQFESGVAPVPEEPARPRKKKDRNNFRLGSEGIERLDLVKRELCFLLQQLILRRQWTQRQAAIRIGTTNSCLSLVYNYRLKRLSISQLFRYLAIIEPRFRFLVAV